MKRVYILNYVEIMGLNIFCWNLNCTPKKHEFYCKIHSNKHCVENKNVSNLAKAPFPSGQLGDSMKRIMMLDVWLSSKILLASDIFPFSKCCTGYLTPPLCSEMDQCDRNPGKLLCISVSVNTVFSTCWSYLLIGNL